MSRGERLFTPMSLERVAHAVEWEDELVFYKDGTTNQQRYMQAMAILWERWMRGWSLPDFAKSIAAAGSNKFAEGLSRIVRSIPARISQVKGFWEGVWYGANPDRAAQESARILAAGGELSDADLIRIELDTLFRELRTLLL